MEAIKGASVADLRAALVAAEKADAIEKDKGRQELIKKLRAEVTHDRLTLTVTKAGKIGFTVKGFYPSLYLDEARLDAVEAVMKDARNMIVRAKKFIA